MVNGTQGDSRLKDRYVRTCTILEEEQINVRLQLLTCYSVIANSSFPRKRFFIVIIWARLHEDRLDLAAKVIACVIACGSCLQASEYFAATLAVPSAMDTMSRFPDP